MKRLPLLILAGGSCLSLIILACSLFFLETPAQCPTAYTQQQIDETGCIIGANIGYGPALGVAVSIGLEILTVIVALAALLLGASKTHEG
jgi:hypothetical protein